MYYTPYAVQYPTRTTAPVSVHLAAFAMYAVGALAALASAAVFAVSRGSVGTADGLPQTMIRGGLPVAIGVGLYALCWLFIGRKVQRGRQWARVLVLVLSALSLIGAALTYYRFGNVATGIGTLVLSAGFVILLNTRAARSWFRYHNY